MRNPLAAASASVLLILGVAACAQPAKSQDASSNASKGAPQGAASFMAQNALQPGVQSLPSGVQYKIVKSGPATGAHPTPEDKVKVNYEGALVTGEVFDSSFKRGQPVTFVLGNLIPGWIDALQQMRPGDEWILYVPPNMGYGDRQAGPIPPGSVLVFRLQLLAVGADAGPESN
jgi:peptidylprolyl isomerase/FKBP-type peptidyl-prolyl cis-trans isomerase FklB